VPWPKGAIQPNTPMRLAAANGTRIEVQTWPLAYWPDGSVKWTGHAIAAPAELAGPFTLTPTNANEERNRTVEIKYSEDATASTTDTGAVRLRLAKAAGPARLTLVLANRTLTAALIALRATAQGDVPLTGDIERVTLEQTGPIRAVVKLEGR